MVYVKQTWIDGAGGGTPLSAARLNHIEDGIEGKADTTQSRVSVASYGAVGNNTADDTTAIQAAIDALPIGGGEVCFPTGTYKLSSALVLDSGITLVGDGDDTTVIRQSSTSASCVTGSNVEKVGLRNIQLVGPGSGTGHGLSLAKGIGNHIAYVSLENVTVYDFGGDGIRIENPIVSTFSRVVSTSNGGYGCNLFGQTGGAAGTSCSLIGCYANANTTAGYRLYNMVYSTLSGCAADGNPIGYLVDSCQSVTLSGCGGESNTTATFKVAGGYGVSLAGAWVYDNKAIGVWATGSASVLTVIGAIDNTPNGTATNFIKVDTGCHVVLLSCNNITANSLAAGTTLAVDATGFLSSPTGAYFESGIGVGSGDVELFTNTKGLILIDRSNSNRYRLVMTGGVLGVEVA